MIDKNNLPYDLRYLFDPDHKPVEVTQSMIVSYMTCPQKYAFQYLLRLKRSETSVPLIIGRAFHSGMEVLLDPEVSTDPSDRFDAIRDAIDKVFDEPEEQTDMLRPSDSQKMEVGRAQAHAMLNSWFIMNGDLIDQWEIHSVEKKIRCVEGADLDSPLCDRMGGTIDGVISDDDGAWVLENKTKASVSDIDIRGLELDTQALYYTLLAVYRGEERGWPVPQGLFYNAVQKPKHRMSPAGFDNLVNRMQEAMVSDPQKYFSVTPVIFDKQTVTRAYTNFERVVAKIDSLTPDDIFMSTGDSHTSPCNKFGGCPFRALCENHADFQYVRNIFDLPGIDQFVVKKHVHSELEEDANGKNRKEATQDSGATEGTGTRGVTETRDGTRTPGKRVIRKRI